MARKMFARCVSTWQASTFHAYMVTLVQSMSWAVFLALALMIFRSVSQGAQLLLLVPLMQLLGLDVDQGSIGWLSDFVHSMFALVGVSPTPATVLGAFLLFTVTLATITRWQTTFNFKLQEGFTASLRRRLYQVIANANWLTFSRLRASDFTHSLTNELDRVGSATSILLQFVAGLVLLPVYVALTLQLSVAMTLLVFASGSVLLIMLRRRTRRARAIGEEISQANSNLYSAAIEHLDGMKTVKSYGAEERNADVFSRLTGQVVQAYVKGNRHYAGTAFWFAVGSAVLLSMILFISLEFLKLSAASLLLLLFLFNRMIPLFSGIQQNYQLFLNELPAFERVMDLQRRCEAAAEPKVELPTEIRLHDDVRFEDVSFAYDGEGSPPTVNSLDVLIPAGKTTAVVGPSGAGKSTVADLLMGLIIPSEGRVLVDRVSLGTQQVRSWRNQIGYVAQDTFLFNDTVRANLLWACPEASEEEIWGALRSAAAEEFVAGLPDGLETVLGDRGVRLSGGERQRMALARALLRQPSLLILDEATSALDSENEKRVQSAIEELHGHMTIVVITHRLSTIRRADVIHVLEEGRLVESGSWNALTRKEDGRFNALCSAQGVLITD